MPRLHGRPTVAELLAQLEDAYDAQHDAKHAVERLEAKLQKLTGCDCTALGLTCTGHNGRAPLTPEG